MIGLRCASFVLLVSVASVSLTLPAPAQDPIPRILLVGDSWTSFMWEARSFRTALSNKGLGQYEERGGRTTVSGSKASEWAQESYLRWIEGELTMHPTIDVVLLCVGGNDILGGGNIAQVVNDIETIVDRVLGLREDLKVLLMEYTYFNTNFGAPNIRAQNDGLTQRARAKFDLAQRKDRMYYQLNLGILQATFGLPGQFEAGEVPAPGGPPDYEPFPGGDPDFPAPPDAFRDDLHLITEGYLILAERAVDQFLAEWLSERLSFRRGDCNDDGRVNIADAVCILNWLFAGGAIPGCIAATNTNGDDAANITDATYLLNHLFAGGPAPVAPFAECGPGELLADETLGCANPCQ